MKDLPKYLIILLFMFFIFGCKSVNLNNLTSQFTPIPDSIKKLDIPKYETKNQINGYPSVYWHYAKQKEQQLGLKSAELSNDSLIFRIWITNPGGKKERPHGLIEIKHDFYRWTCTLYLMYVKFNASKFSETVTKYDKMNLRPKKGDWDYVIYNLHQLLFDILPTDKDIPNYYKGTSTYRNNEPRYSFEYATGKLYRFYQYTNVEEQSNQFWQAYNILKILELLDEVFNWDEIGHAYFRKKE